ncbi:MAG: hypothetical protein ACRELV_14825 [Longimicrobiales bacterium]
MTRFRDGDALRADAVRRAAAGEYRGAATVLDRARLAYEEAGARAIWSGRVESALDALAPLRAAAQAGPSRQQAAALEEDAEASARAGRFQEALQQIDRAAELYRQAAAPVRVAAPEPDPSPQAAAPPPDPAAELRAGVDAALAQLRDALEAEDLTALRRVWLDLGSEEARAFGAFFNQMENIQVELDVEHLELEESQARVTIQTTYSFYNDGTAQRQTSRQELTIARRDGRWVIVSSR